jgi:hypothetical protein
MPSAVTVVTDGFAAALEVFVLIFEFRSFEFVSNFVLHASQFRIFRFPTYICHL